MSDVDQSWGYSNKAAIAGLCIAIVAFVVLVCFYIILIAKRRQRARQSEAGIVELTDQNENDNEFIESVLPRPARTAMPYGRNPFHRSQSQTTLPAYNTNDLPPSYQPPEGNPFADKRDYR